MTKNNDVIMPDFEEWGRNVEDSLPNYDMMLSKEIDALTWEEKNVIAIALKQAFSQGRALGYREGHDTHKHGIIEGYVDPIHLNTVANN